MRTNLYEALPVPLQHLATAVYGARQRWIRRHGAYHQTRRFLEESQWWDAERIATFQKERLREVVAHALRATRFWPERFRELGLDASHVRSVDDLRRLPVLDKATVLKRADDLRASDVQGVRSYFTSGTTGTTLTVPIDDASRQRNYAFFARALSWAGVEDARGATFAGRPVVSSSVIEPSCVWRWNPAMSNRLFSSYHLSEANAGAYSRALCSYQPTYIDTYPSALSSLALHLKTLGLPAPKLRAIITSSETLMAGQRQLLAEVFGAPCFDQYGCTEQAVYVSQCEQGRYHIHAEYGIAEVLGSDGEPARPGESGEIVCTSFTNDAFPLLRFRIGDVATVGEPGCPCGRAFPVLSEIVGRIDDLLVTPDGRQIGRLDPVFKGRRTILEAQIIQENATNVLVRLVRGDGYTEADGDAVRAELEARLGAGMEIEILPVDEIERTSSGKFRAVINRHRTATRIVDG